MWPTNQFLKQASHTTASSLIPVQSDYKILRHYSTSKHTHTRLTALFPGLPGWAGTRKAKPIWILLKQEKVSGSGISWTICKSTPRSRQITTPAPHHSVFYRPGALPVTRPTASKHWRHIWTNGYLFHQHRYNTAKTVKTKLCRLDGKAQKSTYNCSKIYVNEETHCTKTKH